MNKDLPSLDVIIPCFNEELEIGGCLDALLVQEAEINCIIAVDNNSTDKTQLIIKQYERQYPGKVKYVFEESQGVIPARDKGFSESQSDVMARIDADTRVSKVWARALRDFYAQNPSAVAGTGLTEFYDLPARRITRFLAWLFMDVGNKVSGGSVHLYGANMSIRRSAWDEVKSTVNMRKDIMEDLSIGVALGNKGHKTSQIRDAFALVSGRRLRTSPRQFAKYNMQWPRTYSAYGKHLQAFLTGIPAVFGIVFQVIAAFLLQWHDPRTNKFRLRKVSNYEQRVIP